MIPCRCNRRSCQGRVNLSKRPEAYKKSPKCKKCGIGHLYVDKYRLRKGDKDKAPVCKNDNCRYRYPDKKNRRPYHRIDIKGCIHYDEYREEVALRGTVKNSPIRAENLDNPPF